MHLHQLPSPHWAQTLCAQFLSTLAQTVMIPSRSSQLQGLRSLCESPRRDRYLVLIKTRTSLQQRKATYAHTAFKFSPEGGAKSEAGVHHQGLGTSERWQRQAPLTEGTVQHRQQKGHKEQRGRRNDCCRARGPVCAHESDRPLINLPKSSRKPL